MERKANMQPCQLITSYPKHAEQGKESQSRDGVAGI
jgi:hypothetical protein